MGIRYLNRVQLDQIVRMKSALTIFRGEPSFDDERDDCHPRQFRNSFRPAPDVLFLGEIPEARYVKFWWPGEPSYLSLLESIIKHRWKTGYDVTIEEDHVVGRADDIDIRREVDVFTRRAFSGKTV